MLEIFDVMRNHPVLCADFSRERAPCLDPLESPFKPQGRKYFPLAAHSYHQFVHVFIQAVLSAYMRVPEFIDGRGESDFPRHWKDRFLLVLVKD